MILVSNMYFWQILEGSFLFFSIFLWFWLATVSEISPKRSIAFSTSIYLTLDSQITFILVLYFVPNNLEWLVFCELTPCAITFWAWSSLASVHQF